MAVSEPGLAWSPEQISRRLRLDFPEDPTMRISHEAIYRHCYHDPVSNVVHLFLIIQTRRTITMISRADAHRAAIHLIDALGPEAAKAAHERSSEMLTLGDAGRYAVWAMILDTIEDILDQEPQIIGRVH